MGSETSGRIRRALRAVRRYAVPVLAVIVAAPLIAMAQTDQVRTRITARIDEANLTTLRGNTHPLARPQFDQGAVADSQPMRRMLLLLRRSPEQETALRALIEEQQTGTSPNFHRWLTPQQIGQQFGPAAADIQVVTDWLQSHGFQVSRVSASGTLIEFAGTAGQVRNAFHTEIHRYSMNGQVHVANASDPQIPAALAPVVVGPVSLHNFPRKPLSRVAGVFQKDRTTGKVTSVPSPNFTYPDPNPPDPTGCGANPVFSSDCNAIGPGDFGKIYNVGPLWTLPGINNHVIDGSGQTIAIVGDSEICTASTPPTSASQCGYDDVADFRSLFGLSTSNLPTIILDGPDPGFNSDEIEGDLDVQWSGAIAKNAKIDFVIAETTEASAGTDLAAEYIVDNNLAPVMSESFGQCEAFLLAGGNLFESALWEQAAAQGMTVVVSAGDSGSAGCDDNNTQSTAVNGANINGIASTPFNVAAGGTDFDISATNYPSAFWAPPNPSATSPFTSALSYIPEVPWNDSCGRTPTTVCTSSNPLFDIVAGGGGQSSCVNPSTDSLGNITGCQNTSGGLPGWNKPSFQPPAFGLTAGTDLTRDIPDISLFAATGAVSNSFYIVCDRFITQGQCSLGSTILFAGVGGTSSASPAFAGIMALVNQNMAVNHGQSATTGQGNADYVLYSLFSAQIANTAISCNSSSGPNTACTFYDVTKGDNSVPCTGGTPANCTNTLSGGIGFVWTGTGTNPSYTAGTGYDLATGLGSINVANLVTNWSGTSGVGSFTPTTTTLCLSTSQSGCASSTSSSSLTGTITHGQTIYVWIGVTPNPASTPAKAEDAALIGTISGNVVPVDRFDGNSLSIKNADIYPLGSAGTISAASTKELVGGTYTVSARYGGDGKFGSSTSTGVPITIQPEGSTALLSVISVNPATGTFTSTPVTTAAYGALNNVRVDIKGASSGLKTGTGSVTLKDNGSSIVDPNDNLVTSFTLNTEGYTEDQTQFLSAGMHNLSATYGGDASYSPTTTAATLTFDVSKGATTASVSASPTAVPNGTPVTLTAFVDTLSNANFSGGSHALAPSGTVTFFNGTTALTNGTVPVSVVVEGDLAQFSESTATMNVTLPSSAIATITAVYNGDSNYAVSPASTGVQVTVGVPGINVSSCTGGIPGVTPGLSGTCLVTVTGVNGFSGTVALTAALASGPSGYVYPPSCNAFGMPDLNFSGTNTITLSSANTSGNATMTCTTTPGVGSVMVSPTSRPSGHGWPLATVTIAFAAFLLLFAVRRERRWSVVPLIVLLAVAVLAGVSCNGGYNGGGIQGHPPTTAGTYTFNVTATPNSGTPQTTTVAVVVQ